MDISRSQLKDKPWQKSSSGGKRCFFRILCVEDHTTLQQALKLGLGAYGFEVVMACHGHDALVKYKAEKGRLSAILTDHDLPYMNGLEFVRTVRGLGYKGPIIVMSGRLGTDHLQAYREHDIRGFFSKPFQLASLAATLLQPEPRGG